MEIFFVMVLCGAVVLTPLAIARHAGRGSLFCAIGFCAIGSTQVADRPAAGFVLLVASILGCLATLAHIENARGRRG